jgi:hypothetical protein
MGRDERAWKEVQDPRQRIKGYSLSCTRNSGGVFLRCERRLHALIMKTTFFLKTWAQNKHERKKSASEEDGNLYRKRHSIVTEQNMTFWSRNNMKEDYQRLPFRLVDGISSA